MLEVRLLGTFAIQCDGKPVTISSRIAQSLFAFLILNAGTTHRREKLAGMLWPDVTEDKARAYLRHELWLLRKTIFSNSKTDYLLTDDINISFNSSAKYWLDVNVLKSVSERASVEEMVNALSVFQREFLPGFYEDWIVVEREHLQAIYEQKMRRLLELLESEKRPHEILDWAERWISCGQGPEAAYRYLMVAYDALGDHAKVASTYQRCVQVLRELDLEPSEQTRALAFKRNPKINIPIPLTSFIGRAKELKEIADLFSKSRLITLTGSGGVGKTRLAIQVVADVLDMFPDGVWFIALDSLSDPALVPQTVASVFDIRESQNQPVIEILKDVLRQKTALLILDNCEHLAEACAQLITALLMNCPNLAILATSRETLNVAGEAIYSMPSLSLPEHEVSLDELSKYESVKLFAERAALAISSFALKEENIHTIVDICRRVDGIPLAIELAAARVNILNVAEILKQLQDSFSLLAGGGRMGIPRHQTLRASMDWSWGLLSEAEQIFLRQLSIFAGGWTFGAAQEVYDGDVLNLTSALVTKSLIVVDQQSGRETRYRLHEIVRQYAREKLIESGNNAPVRDRHLAYFVQLAERAEPELVRSDQVRWQNRLCDELDNGCNMNFRQRRGKMRGQVKRKEADMKGKHWQAEWSGLSEELMEEVTVWRAQPPKATLREIEVEIDRRLSGLRAKMITDIANRGASAEWETTEGVVCPECGAKLVKKGKKKRILLTRDGQRIELVRDYGVCVACGQGIFPPG